MSTQYYLQKIPVEAVEPGYSLAIPDAARTGGKFRLFQVDSIQVSQRDGQPPMVTLTSDGAATLDYEAGTPVVRLFGICAAAAS
ncbi:hypothetical protein [Mycobacterium vicinigordonae]|uniref:Uncharacterized protein n=1 Tax=Mycobacterium vicinigordonae TaxID=1719132 RepID=A0A7D6E3Q1_9MYCO|nr:hypothetical protein [Mycobacterium vicinigordonae]QLL06582.1 hypothetical protein H0P51_23090 [Mycobacterium vicinigordonae]